jgi:hypothetical protein
MIHKTANPIRPSHLAIDTLLRSDCRAGQAQAHKLFPMRFAINPGSDQDRGKTGGTARAAASGFSIAATFDGEFSDNVTSYSGKGVFKYSW